MAAVMESRLRYRFFGADGILQGAGVKPGLTVLEIGCGTGYFTIPAARLLGEQGHLVSMDALEMSVEAVTKRVREAGLGNVEVLRGDALDTRLADERFDIVLVFGVIPAPMLPMPRLLAEMRRVLKPGGVLAVWPATWVHGEIAASPFFRFTAKRNGVLSYVGT
jgi:demethylmenaquinone methyltransferase/2-methoxy-6-polyprenyl-1,4-benzoquinol methylase